MVEDSRFLFRWRHKVASGTSILDVFTWLRKKLTKWEILNYNMPNLNHQFIHFNLIRRKWVVGFLDTRYSQPWTVFWQDEYCFSEEQSIWDKTSLIFLHIFDISSSANSSSAIFFCISQLFFSFTLQRIVSFKSKEQKVNLEYTIV